MKEKRYELIKDYIIKKNHVTLKELEEEFNVSMNTVRRDVNKILQDPKFEKVYGGVCVKKETLINFSDRNIENKEIKKRIAKEAAKFILPNDLIYIDSGTTTKYLLDYLDKEIEISIITNSLDVINKAEKFNHIPVYLVGHMLKKSTRSFVGIEADEIGTKYNIDKAFMAATAISTTNGLMNSDVMEYEIKKQAIEKAKEVYLLADSNKFDKSTLLTYAPLNSVDYLITDQIFNDLYQNYFNKYDIKIIES